MADVRSAQNLSTAEHDSGLAKVSILNEIYNVAEGWSLNRAVKKIEELSRAGQLPDHLRDLAQIANAKAGRKQHLLTFRSLRRWIADDKPEASLAERIARLAPRKPGVDYALKDDVGAVLALFKQPNKPSLMWCAKEVAREHGINYRQLRDRAARMIKKVPKAIFYGGRNSGAALKAMQTFRRRGFLHLHPNDVWTGDGHAMKCRIAHPETGAPFVPELTIIMDVGSRYIVGWSISFSENCIAVSDALRNSIQAHGMPLIYYSDNGSGQKNKTFDAPVTGILGALNIRHETGIPGNPQGRGAMERLWKTVAIPAAKTFPTFRGHGADRDTLKNVMRDINKDLRARKNGEVSVIPRGLPTLGELMTVIDTFIGRYNNEHEHSELPKINGIPATPASWRAHRTVETSTEPLMLAPQELASLFMPSALRKASRLAQEVQPHANSSSELGS